MRTSQWLAAFSAAVLALYGCHTLLTPPNPGAASPPSTAPAMQTPIIFVHGNGDTAALWHTTLWRFESSGYERRLLHAIDFTYPLARSDDAKPMDGRSSTDDQLRELSVFVDQVRAQTGAAKVAMVASSRGANAVRHYIRNGGGASDVSHVVLCGGVNHGVYVSLTFNTGSEFNGAGPFMTRLNARYPDGYEVTPGVRWMTIRSDNSDKYAQPDGRFVGQPGMATQLGAEAPALAGAENIVLARADHREVAFGPEAFAEMFRFITGTRPSSTRLEGETIVKLDGKVSGYLYGAPTNLPLPGATVTVHRVDAQTGMRMRVAPHRKVVGPDGSWGPLTVDAATSLEFVIEAPGHPTTHIYRSPFARSSAIVHLRTAPPGTLTADDSPAGAVVIITRPRGYFGVGRDAFTIDGKVPTGVTDGVPAVSSARMRMATDATRTVTTRFNDETIAVIAWPARDGHVVYAEFHG